MPARAYLPTLFSRLSRTRLDTDHGKSYFTIIDFRGVSRLFADPAFDGEPIEIIDGNKGTSSHKSHHSGVSDSAKQKYEVNRNVKVSNAETQFLDEHGNLITTSLVDYTKKNILGEYATLDNFLQAWNKADKKQVLLDEMEKHGILYKEIIKQKGIRDMDPFDLMIHLAYNQKPLTKSERIKNVKKSGILDKYQGAAREILDALLEKYKDDGIIWYFDIYEMKAVVSGSENSDNNGKIASLLNELGGGKNARQLFYFALKNNGVLSDESQQESLHKWRAVSNFADFTGLDLRDFSLKNGEFVGKDGTKALDLLKVGVANSSTPADFKGVAHEYAKGFIDEMASLGGLEKVPDLKVSIAYDKESGFYAPKSDFYA